MLRNDFYLTLKNNADFRARLCVASKFRNKTIERCLTAKAAPKTTTNFSQQPRFSKRYKLLPLLSIVL